MDIVDLIITIIIFLVFSLVYFFNISFIELQNIKDGWKSKGYKCNPMIIPFTATIWAGDDGGDVTKQTASANFADCIKVLTADKLLILLKPIKDSLGGLSSIAGNLTDSMGEIFDYIDSFRDSLGNLTGGLTGIFGNILGSFNLSFGEIGKLGESVMAIMYIGVYIMQTTLMLGQSLFNGPIGGALKLIS